MSAIMVSYDLSTGHNEVKTIAFANGWYNLLVNNMGQKEAPNTVICCNNASLEDAFAKFHIIVAQASMKLGRTIVVEKVIAVRYDSFIINSNGP